MTKSWFNYVHKVFHWPTPASFCLFSFFSNTNFTEKNYSRQRDSNSDRRSRRQVRGPLDHTTAHAYKVSTIIKIFQFKKVHFSCTSAATNVETAKSSKCENVIWTHEIHPFAHALAASFNLINIFKYNVSWRTRRLGQREREREININIERDG